MCFDISLCKTNNGEVLLSSCCGRVKIRYKNLDITNCFNVFEDFFKSIESCYYSVKEEQNRDKRVIVFQTVVDCMQLRFSASEVDELYYLLQSALIEYHVAV